LKKKVVIKVPAQPGAQTLWPANAISPRIQRCAWPFFFGVSPDFWMNLQKTYELDLAIREHGAEIEASFTEEAL
jgi:hypothetical protein